MATGPCARCLKKLDLKAGDTVWFCMQCPDVMGGGARYHTGYTYWLCPSCHTEHGDKDHEFHFSRRLAEEIFGRSFDFDVQHHLGTHKFMSISEGFKEKLEEYQEFLDLGVEPKYLIIMDGAFEMLQDTERKEVSLESMAEHVEGSGVSLTDHPGGIQGAMAYCLDIETISGVWIGRMDFIKMYIRMTAIEQLVDLDELFKQFQIFLTKQPKRVITVDLSLDPSGSTGTLLCTGIDGSTLASLSVDKSTTLREIEKQLLDIAKIEGFQLKLVTSDGFPLEGRMEGAQCILDLVRPPEASVPNQDAEMGTVGLCIADAQGRASMDAIIELFQRHDANGDGVLNVDELKTLLTELNPPPGQSAATYQDLDILLAAYWPQIDTNGDERIQMPEFVRWLWDMSASKDMDLDADLDAVLDADLEASEESPFLRRTIT